MFATALYQNSISEVSIETTTVRQIPAEPEHANEEKNEETTGEREHAFVVPHEGSVDQSELRPNQFQERIKPTIITLPTGVFWLDNSNIGSELIVRSCYVQLWDIILTAPELRIAVLGSPGIGKSWFLYYCIYRLVTAQTPFVYVGFKGHMATYWTFRDGETQKGSDFTDELRRLFEDQNTVVLVDDRSPFTTSEFPCKIIISSSPNRQKYTETLNEGGASGSLKLYMPVWDDEELELKRQQHARQNGMGLTQDQVQALVNIAGRVPRYIFQHRSFEAAVATNKKDINEALQRKSPEAMFSAAGSSNAADDQTSHRILAIEVDGEFRRVGLAFHSSYVKNVTFRSLTTLSVHQHYNFYRRTAGSLKDQLFERYAHFRIAAGAKVVARSLDEPKREEYDFCVAEATGSLPVFDRTYSDLLNAADNHYLVPASAIFESIDAVCLPNFFQMAVSEAHPIKLARFAEYLITLDEKRRLTGDIPFIFVIPRSKISSFR